MSWLYAQTWLWYLIAFVVGVLLAWLLLVLPQQRRLRTLQSVAGASVDHDLYAESQRAAATAGAGAASGAALFDSEAEGRAAASGDDPATDPATDQFQAVDAEPGDSLDTTELPVQPAPDDTVTGEIPAVKPAAAAGADSTDETAAEPDSNSTGPSAAAAGTTAPSVTTAEDVDDSAADSNGKATAVALGAGAAGFAPARDEAAAVGDEPTSTETAGADSTTAESTTADSATADSATADATGRDADGTVAEDAAADAETSDPEASPADAPAPGPPAAAAAPAGAPDAAATDDAARADNGAHSGVQGLLAAPAAVAPGPYQGSALAGPEGAAPGAEYTIKGNEDSMLFHTPDSPYYSRTKAEVWFRDPADAEAAGFTSWTRNK